jgi:hypothetical protein
MADTARAAAMADPLRNSAFQRRWAHPPPTRKRRPPPGAAIARTAQEQDAVMIDRARAAAQRAVASARRRAEELDRRAELLRLVGLNDAALRTEAIAMDLREVAA